MIAAPNLEIAVLVLGMIVLMFEAFLKDFDKRALALAAIGGLLAVLLATWFLAPSPLSEDTSGFWSFYTADPLSIFFKRFALVTTVVVIIMMLDYVPRSTSSL